MNILNIPYPVNTFFIFAFRRSREAVSGLLFVCPILCPRGADPVDIRKISNINLRRHSSGDFVVLPAQNPEKDLTKASDSTNFNLHSFPQKEKVPHKATQFLPDM
jgi:hypothetical protein